jgi:predicted GNAT family N-acyltransferase
VDTEIDRNKSDLRLVKVTSKEQTELMEDIRRIVFVLEQKVDPAIEYDEFEESSIHFILYKNGKAIGCSRYRWSNDGIKLERYAILKEERGKGYGRFIMDRMLEIVLDLKPNNIYLHSQTVAKGFYGKFGFFETGEIFKEADIDHVMMFYPLSE